MYKGVSRSTKYRFARKVAAFIPDNASTNRSTLSDIEGSDTDMDTEEEEYPRRTEQRTPALSSMNDGPRSSPRAMTVTDFQEEGPISREGDSPTGCSPELMSEDEDLLSSPGDSACDSSDEDSSNEESRPYSVFPQNANMPLYDGADLTIADSFVSIMTFALKHSLTGACLSDILSLIELHCPKPNGCVKSLYSLKKFFSKLSTPTKKHFYCLECHSLLTSKDSVCDFCATTKVGHFIELSIKSQLESMFKRRHFYELTGHRFQREIVNVDGLEDIYDGDVYREQFNNNGFLSHRNNISFTWYTDGVPVYKSSKYALWPLLFAINELPFKKRFLTENIIVGGLWFGPTKPNGNTFLKPFHDVFKELFTEGITVQHPIMGEDIIVRVQLLCGTCDLPAKCLIFNTMQFNGAYGCPRCKTRGATHVIGPRARVHVYPYEEELQLRTHNEMIEFASEVDPNVPGNHVFGVKGPTVLSYLVPDMIKSTSVDYMHSLLLGIVKRQLHLLFDPAFHRERFSMSTLVNVFDEKLTSIKPPSFVQRPPRSIKDHLSYMKASELKNILFYFSIPVFTEVMKEEYLEHHKLLVLATYILNQASISTEELNSCKLILQQYVREYGDLYGPRFMTANLHQLLHYADVVKDLGPLWTTSCFPFEDLNGKILQLVHGTRYPELQICASVSFILNLPSINKSLDDASTTKQFLNKIEGGKRLKLNERIAEHIFSVGSYKYLSPIPMQIREVLEDYGEFLNGNVQLFYRLKTDSFICCSRSYERAKNNISYCVLYGQDNSVGVIEHFIRFSPCGCHSKCKCEAKFYAIVSQYHSQAVVSTYGMPLFFLKKITPLGNMIMVLVEQIKMVCFLVVVGPNSYCVRPVNFLEFE